MYILEYKHIHQSTKTFLNTYMNILDLIFAVLVNHALSLLFKSNFRLILPPVKHVAKFVIQSAYKKGAGVKCLIKCTLFNTVIIVMFGGPDAL